MDKPERTYFNFPVCLLSDIHLECSRVIDEIIDYALYKHTLKLEYGYGTNLMLSASKWFGVTLKNPEHNYYKGRNIYDSIPDNTPMTGIEINMLFDFYKNYKTDYEVTVLTAFLALKSILGTKPYCKTNKDLLLSRMSGNASIGEVSESYKVFYKRYHFDKLMTELQLNWYLIYYAYRVRGFYFSFDLELKQLIEICETKRPSFRAKNLKDTKAGLRKSLQHLK